MRALQPQDVEWHVTGLPWQHSIRSDVPHAHDSCAATKLSINSHLRISPTGMSSTCTLP